MKRFLVGVIALGVMLVPLATSAAAPYKDMFRTNGNGAVAEWYTENEGMGQYAFVLADSSDQGLFVGVQTCSINLVTYEASCWTGFAFPESSSFMMDKKMNTASLAPIMVELWDDTGLNMQTVEVMVDWTGMGSTYKSKTNVISKYGTFKENYHDRATLRDADATGSIDGMDLEGLLYSQMASYRVADFLMFR